MESVYKLRVRISVTHLAVHVAGLSMQLPGILQTLSLFCLFQLVVFYFEHILKLVNLFTNNFHLTNLS